MATDRLDRIAIVLAAGAVGFCAGEMLSPVTGHVQHVQWETLVTGVLAIAAAAWSVRATRHVDIEQGKRHREVMLLTISGRRLSVQRAAINSGLAVTMAERLPKWEHREMPEGVYFDPDVLLAVRLYALRCKVWLGKLGEEFGAKAISDAYPYFDVDVHRHFTMVKARLADVERQLQVLEKDTAVDPVYMPETLRFCDELSKSQEHLAQEMSHFSRELMRLEKAFG